MQAQGLAAVAALLAADHRRLTQGQAGALSQAAARAGGETLTDDTAPLARENGAGDACTVAGATVHRLWPRVRALAVRGGAEGAAVRVRALEVRGRGGGVGESRGLVVMGESHASPTMTSTIHSFISYATYPPFHSLQPPPPGH